MLVYRKILQKLCGIENMNKGDHKKTNMKPQLFDTQTN